MIWLITFLVLFPWSLLLIAVAYLIARHHNRRETQEELEQAVRRLDLDRYTMDMVIEAYEDSAITRNELLEYLRILEADGRLERANSIKENM